MEFPTAKEINKELLASKTGDGPMGRGSLTVFRNDQGLIGGYVAQAPIMDSPIHYYYANGKYLGTFHIFGDSVENHKTDAIVKELKLRFPHEDDAAWLTPITKPGEKSPLLGEWKYVGCSIKNTQVEGILNFFDPRLMIFDGKIHQDYPTSSFRCDYKYYVEDGVVHFQERTNPELHPPISTYFLIQGDRLYFATRPIRKVQDPENTNHKANWTYRLQRH